MAFISSFHGTTTLGRRPVLVQKSPTMKFGSDKMLKKYDDMSRQPPRSQESSKPSGVWDQFSKSMFEKFAPTRRQVFSKTGSYEEMMKSLVQYSSRFRAPGGAPKVSGADNYMADCVIRQYKAMACSNGEYGVTCTEGTRRGMADDSRVLSLGASFRLKQRPTGVKFGDYYTNRKYAIQATHECSYEENLVSKYPQVAYSMIMGMSESIGACVRYANATNPAEKYMSECVDKQNKFRAVTNGLYAATCQDGAAKGLPEFKRVLGLAARFRAGQVGPVALEDRKFQVRKFARENFAGMCGYEEELFNKYSAVCMAMRVDSVRY